MLSTSSWVTLLWSSTSPGPGASARSKKVRGHEVAASLDGLVDELRDPARELDALVARSGLVGKFTSTYRSRAEQERLYRAFISGRHAFPVAPPGSSAHEYGEAFDYLVSPMNTSPMSAPSGWSGAANGEARGIWCTLSFQEPAR